MHRRHTLAGLTLAPMLLVLASCSQVLPPDSKAEAKGRWDTVRARLKLQLAEDAFKAARLDDASRHLDEAISLSPQLPAAYILRARILLEKGETASASEALDLALLNGADNAETDYLSGMISQRYGKFDDALAWYSRAVQREPMHAPYVVAVAETLVSLDRVAEALALVQSRMTDFEQNATLRAVAGGIYMMLGRYEDAANAYRDAARISPEDRRLNYQLGLALTMAENYQEGGAVLASASLDDDADASVLVALGRCRLGLRQASEAKAVLRRATEASPSNPRTWSLLAQACIDSGDLLGARQAAGQAVQLAPESIEYALLLGYVCCMQRDYPAAIATLERILQRQPDDTLALYLLAQAYRGQGDTGNADRCIERIRRIDPNADWATQPLEAPEARPPVAKRRTAVKP